MKQYSKLWDNYKSYNIYTHNGNIKKKRNKK